MTFDKVDYLRLADGSWKFDAYIKDNDIPENALIIADIELLKRLGNSNTKKMNSIANCIHNNKKLECSVIIERSDDDPYIYTPSLIKNKNPNSGRTCPTSYIYSLYILKFNAKIRFFLVKSVFFMFF